MNNKVKLVTGNFVLLFIISIAVCTAMNMLTVIVPLFVTQDLGGTVATSGFLSTTYLVSSCLSRPFNGILVDRLGRQRMMAAGSLLFGLALLLCSWSTAIWMVFVLRACMGVGFSAASTANNTASTDIIPKERMSEGIGYFGISQNFANAAGPAVASYLVALIGCRGSLKGGAFMCFAALILCMFVVYERKQPVTVTPGRKVGFAFEKTAALASVFQGFSLLCISAIMCFMTLYIVHQGLSSGVAGTFFVISSIAIIAVRLIFSRFVERVPRRVLLLPGYGALALACLLLPFGTTPAAFWGISILYGFGHGIVWTTLGSEAVRRAVPERRGAANATFYFAFDAGIGSGAAIWGVLIDAFGFASCFRAAAVGFMILAVLAVFAFRKTEN